MRLETFRGPDLAAVARLAHQSFGDDATIVRTATRRMADGSTAVEVVAADGAEVERFRARLTPSPLPVGDGRWAPREERTTPGPMRRLRSLASRPSPVAPRPFIIALAGPAGAGKTTAAGRLAAHAESSGRVRVGLVTLDTGRPGAVEQLRAQADAARAPLEVVYDPREAEPALRRLAGCELVVVDTPARGARGAESDARTLALLRSLRPDETHLVLDAGVRREVAAGAQRTCEPLGVTHLLLTRLDQVPEGAGVAELAAWLDLPVRWASEGATEALRPGAARVIALLGAPRTVDGASPPLDLTSARAARRTPPVGRVS